jgi:hypothetical protein
MDVQDQGSVAARVQFVLREIRRAAERSGRCMEAIRLVAATKGVSPERIAEAIAAGLRHAGENRLQEALPKIQALQGQPVQWHFIGQLQRRKVRSVVGLFELIHSVDSFELAQEIDLRARTAHLRQPVLLEVNIGGESSKAGFQPEELDGVVPKIGELSHIKVAGLMAIPPPVEYPEQARPYFRRLRELAKRVSEQGFPRVTMDELSMGMSDDYQVAVEEGATMVRIGTAIFGARHV